MRLEIVPDWKSSRVDELIDKFPSIAAQTLNRIVKKSKTNLVQKIRKEFTLRSSDISRAIVFSRSATPSNLASGFFVSNRDVPASRFRHRQTARGVFLQVRQGAGGILLGRFVAIMPSGHLGIFERATLDLKNKSLKTRRERRSKGGGSYSTELPIQEIKAPSVSKLASETDILRTYELEMDRQFEEELLRRLNT